MWLNKVGPMLGVIYSIFMLFTIPHIVKQIKKKLLDTWQVDEDMHSSW